MNMKNKHSEFLKKIKIEQTETRNTEINKVKDERQYESSLDDYDLVAELERRFDELFGTGE